jgi:molybdate transport system permease protein
MDVQALLLSVRLAAVVSIALLIIGLPLAYWLALSRWRGKFLVESIVALPLVLPPTVLGFYVLVAIGAQSPIGSIWSRWFGHGLAFTFEGLAMASILYSLPFAVQPFTAAFSQIDRKLLEAAAILGASPWRTFRTVMLPLSVNGIVTGIVLSFAHTIGEFGVVVMVGGNIPGVTRTVSVAIYDDVQALNFARANATALVLFVFSGLVLALVYALNHRVWSVQPEI